MRLNIFLFSLALILVYTMNLTLKSKSEIMSSQNCITVVVSNELARQVKVKVGGIKLVGAQGSICLGF